MATSGPDPLIRPASRADVPAIVALLRDDPLGREREGEPDDPAYGAAFEAVERDPNCTIYVMEDAGAVIGCAQLILLAGLSRRGMLRGQIEAVRIAASRRNAGLGGRLVAHLVEAARARGCGTVQLTSDKTRLEAHRFYGSLGFTASHEGFKLTFA
ncbi:GNAT family N-acetyltransferase [Salinarimonas soli]|uniref:GNAT family N-acetyltransferase n=1 Tax=Salinarimonas soli TaxID=1638099 RepID=A0A5B2V9B1_9HYPH|nr:GNAT family N-acetyltransferase [Salinarimonas soli]KAA2234929.1 GNAT family N-acetyltransferase [Salinarimonas soli]